MMVEMTTPPGPCPAADILRSYAHVYRHVRSSGEGLTEAAFNALRGAVRGAVAHPGDTTDPMLGVPWVREEMLSIAGTPIITTTTTPHAARVTRVTVYATFIHVVMLDTKVPIQRRGGFPTAPAEFILLLTPAPYDDALDVHISTSSPKGEEVQAALSSTVVVRVWWYSGMNWSLWQGHGSQRD